jgi:hypothetical protein
MAVSVEYIKCVISIIVSHLTHAIFQTAHIKYIAESAFLHDAGLAGS